MMTSSLVRGTVGGRILAKYSLQGIEGFSFCSSTIVLGLYSWVALRLFSLGSEICLRHLISVEQCVLNSIATHISKSHLEIQRFLQLSLSFGTVSTEKNSQVDHVGVVGRDDLVSHALDQVLTAQTQGSLIQL